MNEERENEEQLGHLPEDRIEGQVIGPAEAEAGQEGAGIPVDIQRQEGVVGLDTQPDRLMSQGAEVLSVYDSRPINARDFTDTQFRSVSIPASPTGPVVANFDFFVPGGYIGVLRGFHYENEAPSGSADRTTFACSILVNDIIQVGYENLLLGQVTPKPVDQPCFILAGLKGKITLRLIIDATMLGGVSDLPIYTELYGNLLLTKGVPLNFEIGNLGPISPLGGT